MSGLKPSTYKNIEYQQTINYTSKKEVDMIYYSFLYFAYYTLFFIRKKFVRILKLKVLKFMNNLRIMKASSFIKNYFEHAL